MKVFDLQCANGHVFEGWFASQTDYDAQQARGLVTCPVCQNAEVSKRLSAPRLNMGHHAIEPVPPQADSTAPTPQHMTPQQMTPQQMTQWQAAMLRRMRELVHQTENVGVQFAQEARRIHEGDAQPRPIRGVATHEEQQALAADGIAVMPIPAVFDDERLH